MTTQTETRYYQNGIDITDIIKEATYQGSVVPELLPSGVVSERFFPIVSRETDCTTNEEVNNWVNSVLAEYWSNSNDQS